MKVWFDLCEPKAVKMLRSLYERLAPDHDLRVTARDFDSTLPLMDSWGIPYLTMGKHGGNSLAGKLRSYADRLLRLVNFAEQENPDFLFGLACPEALRVSFGLQIPNIIFNDEPRSVGVVKLSLPFVNHLIVPEPIPIDWYTPLGIMEEQIHKFHGIDEVAETVHFMPDPAFITASGLTSGEYVICRPEQTAAQYFMDRLGEADSRLPILIDPLLEEYPDLTFIWVPRNRAQRAYLDHYYVGYKNVRFLDYLDPIEQYLFHAKLVVTGGGSFVRQSALMNIPSVEYFPMPPYPQEQFLINNDFPLTHLFDPGDNPRAAVEMLERYPSNQGDIERAQSLENPIDLAIELFHELTSSF